MPTIAENTRDEGLALPELRRLGFVLDNLPDGEVVAALEAKRGRGRGEYPFGAMWRALVAGVVFGHDSAASLLRELGRNPALLGVCGFDPLGRQAPTRRTVVRDAAGSAAVHEVRPRRDGVPTAWAFSRFLRNVVELEEETGAVSGMADALRTRLLAELPGFGRHLGYDGKALPSRSTGRRNAKTREDVGPGRGLGEARDVRRGREDRQAVDEGEDVVRLRAAPDRGRGARDPGVVRGDGGGGGGIAGAVGGGGRVVRGGAGTGGAARELRYRGGTIRGIRLGC